MQRQSIEKIYIIQPITRENADKYRILQQEAVALIESAGAVYAGTIYQNLREIKAATYIGEGKLAELNEILDGLDGITVLFNGELTPSQTLNISAALGDRKVIDRTTLILDIFAKNAVSSEGKIQVELAQLKYLYPRLKGKGAALSRLGGGGFTCGGYRFGLCVLTRTLCNNGGEVFTQNGGGIVFHNPCTLSCIVFGKFTVL